MDMLQAKLFVRGVNNSGAKIILAFILARTPLDVQEIREWTGISKRETIYDGLNSLKSIGMVESQTLGHGRMVWLPSSDLLPGFNQMSEKRTPELPSVSIQESENRTSGFQMSGQMSAQRTPAISISKSHINLTDSDPLTTPSMQMSEKRTPENDANQLPSVADILKHTDLLFDGSVVFSKGLDHLEPLNVLAWCAYAYQQREHLSAPAGYLRNRLKENEKPNLRALSTWRETLPDCFLEALHLIEFECEICKQTFETQQLLQEHRREHPDLLVVCPTCQQKFDTTEALQEHVEQEHESTIPMTVDWTLVSLWRAVLSHLQADMPKASFETWVQSTAPVRCDRNVLQVGVRNAYAKDWLTNRLTNKVNQLLGELVADQSMTVEFITANVEAIYEQS